MKEGSQASLSGMLRRAGLPGMTSSLCLIGSVGFCELKHFGRNIQKKEL